MPHWGAKARREVHVPAKWEEECSQWQSKSSRSVDLTIVFEITFWRQARKSCITWFSVRPVSMSSPAKILLLFTVDCSTGLHLSMWLVSLEHHAFSQWANATQRPSAAYEDQIALWAPLIHKRMWKKNHIIPQNHTIIHIKKEKNMRSCSLNKISLN